MSGAWEHHLFANVFSPFVIYSTWTHSTPHSCLLSSWLPLFVCKIASPCSSKGSCNEIEVLDRKSWSFRLNSGRSSAWKDWFFKMSFLVTTEFLVKHVTSEEAGTHTRHSGNNPNRIRASCCCLDSDYIFWLYSVFRSKLNSHCHW